MRFSPPPRGSFPSHYLSARKVHTWRRSGKGKRTGRSSDPAFKHSRPTSTHPAMPTMSHHGKSTVCHRKRALTTNPTLLALEGVLCGISQSPYFLQVRKSLLYTLLPEQQILSLFSVLPRNFEKRILAFSSFKGIECTVPEEIAHAC